MQDTYLEQSLNIKARIRTWNLEQFPFKLIFLGDSILLCKYQLDNLEGDVSLEEAPLKFIEKYKGEFGECMTVINKYVANDRL